MQAPWYVTREDVKSALNYNDSARSNAEVDRAVESASRSVENLLHRHFYPLTGVASFDWPNHQSSYPWRLYLDRDELISLTSLVSGGVTISTASVNLEPVNSGPPFTYLELNRSSSVAFSGGTTPQQSTVVTGIFGASNETASAGALAASATSGATTIDITDGSVIGIGDLLLCGTEQMIVTGRVFIDTSQTVDGLGYGASNADNVLTITGGTFNVGEVIRIHSEQMLVLDTLTSTTILVKRAINGTILGSGSATTAIYASRRLTVTRAAVGTTAAAHSNSAGLTKNVAPGQVRTLTMAESINQIEQESSAYARTIGSGDNLRSTGGRALKDLRAEVADALGRNSRMRVVM